MRVLLVNWQDRENPNAGGAEVHLHSIFGRLTARGHQVDLICSGWEEAPPQTTLDGMRVQRVGSRYSFAALGRGAVRRALRERAYDVVVEDINKFPLFIARLTSLPSYVVVPHLFGTTAFAEASWPIATVVWLAERLIPRAYRRSAFHAISESTRDDLVARGVLPTQIRVILPGVDAKWFAPDPDEPRAPRPTFLYVGRLKRYKGVETAIRALAIARKSHDALALEIAGTGADRPRLAVLAQRLQLGSAVRFLGFVSEETKRTLFRKAWANIFPSAKEGWGITNVEAAACGTPSLASNTSALTESVRHDETGFLVPHGDATALAQRMILLASNPALVERLGQAARHFARQLSWEQTTDLTERHLLDCVQGA